MFLINGLTLVARIAIPILTELFIWIDSAIFGAARLLLGAFFKLIDYSTNMGEYSQQLYFIIQRVTVLAGVYALFRLAIMLINYLIDPSKLKNANKNGTDIVKGIIVSVVLLITSSLIFDLLNEFQRLVLMGNKEAKLKPLIPSLIYGSENVAYPTDEEDPIKLQSKQFVNSLWLLFFTPRDNYPCTADSRADRCEIYRKVAEGEDKIADLAGYYREFNYTPIIPLIVGITLCYFFVVFAIELAQRIFKLLVLQVISPIPIIMYIDPTQREKLKNFAKTYSSLYLQVFFRVISFYLGFVVVYLVINPSNKSNDGEDIGIYLKLILILGIFAAVKELPKLLDDVLGLKMAEGAGGKGSFGKVLGGIIGGGVGLAGGAIAGGISGGAGGALAGAASGLFGGITSGASSKNVGDGVKRAVANIGKSGKLGAKIYDARVDGKNGLANYMYGKLRNATGAQRNDAAHLSQFDKDIEKTQKSIDNINQANSLREKLQSTMDDNFTKTHGDFDKFFRSDERDEASSLLYTRYNELQNQIGIKAESDPNYFSSGEWKNDQITLDKYRKGLDETYKLAKESYFDTQITGATSGTSDAKIAEALKAYNDYVTSKGLSDRTIKSYNSGDNAMTDVKSNLEKDLKEKTQALEKYKNDKKNYESRPGVKASKAANNNDPKGRPTGR